MSWYLKKSLRGNKSIITFYSNLLVFYFFIKNVLLLQLKTAGTQSYAVGILKNNVKV